MFKGTRPERFYGSFKKGFVAYCCWGVFLSGSVAIKKNDTIKDVFSGSDDGKVFEKVVVPLIQTIVLAMNNDQKGTRFNFKDIIETNLANFQTTCINKTSEGIWSASKVEQMCNDPPTNSNKTTEKKMIKGIRLEFLVALAMVMDQVYRVEPKEEDIHTHSWEYNDELWSELHERKICADLADADETA